MAKEKKTEDSSTYWDRVRDFRTSRSPFWIGFGITALAVIIPIIVIWVLLGYDFNDKNFSHYWDLSSPQTGYIALILTVGLPVWGYGIISIFFFTKLCKADLYTYTTAFILVALVLILNGSWMKDWHANPTLKIFIRFVFILFAAGLGSFAGVIISSFAQNYRYKIEEEDYTILEAYKNGEPVPSKEMLRIERAQADAEKREQQRKELDEFKAGLDQKLLESYDSMDRKNKAKADKRKAKLDAKEAKKREKDSKR